MMTPNDTSDVSGVYIRQRGTPLLSSACLLAACDVEIISHLEITSPSNESCYPKIRL